MKILIVEDEVIASSYLKKLISKAGYTVVGTVGTGKGAIELAKSKKPDLILMDIMLKDAISGVDAAIEIKRHQKEIMIVFLTAYIESSMVETAIDAEASGYFLKPYNKEEILVNLKLLSAKPKKKNQDTEYLALTNGYRYNIHHKQLYLHKKEIFLSQRELQIIDYFSHNSHVVLDFDTIIQHIWNGEKSQQTLRSLIHRIREKTCQELIINVNKMGYKIAIQQST